MVQIRDNFFLQCTYDLSRRICISAIFYNLKDEKVNVQDVPDQIADLHIIDYTAR